MGKIARPHIPLTTEFDGAHPGETLLLVGGAYYIADMDMHELEGYTSIGCNRGLMHPYFKPTYLMVSDRRPYIAEMTEGRYEANADEVKLLFSTSIFDPIIRCHNTPVQKPPTSFRWYPWRVTGSSKPMEWRTLSHPLNSFANAAGPMLQAAVIMGAKRIAMTGLGIVPVKGKKGHFYKTGIENNRDPWNKRTSHSRPMTVDCFKKGKKALDAMGVQVLNISPENGPFEEIWGRVTLDQFLEVANG